MAKLLNCCGGAIDGGRHQWAVGSWQLAVINWQASELLESYLKKPGNHREATVKK